MRGTSEEARDPMSDVTVITDRRALQNELRRAHKAQNRKNALGGILRALIAIIAMAAIISTLFLPVLTIDGNSMSDTLHEGNVVVVMRGSRYDTGDVVSFYHNNDILIKRVIASEGQWVDMDDAGRVYVDGEMIEEPYVTEPARGECDIDFPYQVPDGRVFVLGDHRSTSIDSRSNQIGPVREDLIMGKIVLRIWPIADFGIIGKAPERHESDQR